MKTRARRAGAVDLEAADVASGTECTGLIPALGEDVSQEAASAALYGIHSAKGSRGAQIDK